MARESIPSHVSLEKPERYQDLLKEDRGDDCLPCRIVGMTLPLPELAPQPQLLANIECFRRRRIPRLGSLQLLLGPHAATKERSGHPQEQTPTRHAHSADRNHGFISGAGVVGPLEAVPVALVRWRCTISAPSSVVDRRAMCEAVGRDDYASDRCAAELLAERSLLWTCMYRRRWPSGWLLSN